MKSLDIVDLDAPCIIQHSNYFKNLMSRGYEAISSLRNAYAPEKEQVDIVYVWEDIFNAFADKRNQGYLIGINLSVPVKLKHIFNLVCSSPACFKQGSKTTEDIASREFKALPMISKNQFFNVMKALEQSSPKEDERKKLSLLLSDYCLMFVLFHEVGHIVSGHCESNSFHFNDGNISEFFALEEFLFRGRYLKRSWEYEADTLSSVLVFQMLDSLYEHRHNYKSLVSFTSDETIDKTKILSLFTAALFVMFVYMGSLSSKPSRLSHHPHPFVRINYIQQNLRKLAKKKWGIVVDLTEDFFLFYDQFYLALDGYGLVDEQFSSGRFEQQIFSDTHNLQRKFTKYRRFNTSWSWIPDAVWQL